MRLFVVLLVMAVMLLPVPSHSADRDYIYLDKHGNYQGFARDSGDSVDFYDRNNMPSGSYNRDAGVYLDRNNNFGGFIVNDDDDD